MEPPNESFFHSIEANDARVTLFAMNENDRKHKLHRFTSHKSHINLYVWDAEMKKCKLIV